MADDVYSVQRSLRIDAPPARIFDQIADFRKWRNWSPWENLDPALERSYSGAESGTNAAYAWSGNRKAGRGRMTITEAIEPSRVAIDLVFEKPWKSRSDTLFTVEPEGPASLVTWSITGKKTLMTKAMGIFKSMDDLLGPDFERGLSRLKAAAEGRAPSE